MRIGKPLGWTSRLDLAKARSRLRGSSLGFSLSSPHQRDRFSLYITSQGQNLFKLSQKITYVKLLKCKIWVVFSCNHLCWNNICMSLQIKGIRLITYFLLSWVQISDESSKLTSFSEITNVLLCFNKPIFWNSKCSVMFQTALRTKISSMHIKFYVWNASIKYERIKWYNSRFDKNGPSMIKTKINFTDIALKTLRKNVNIPLPSDNSCMCLYPKEQSLLRLSNDSDHSLIDTIGRALLTLLGGNFELLLQIRTRDNKRYVIKWIRFICKNVYTYVVSAQMITREDNSCFTL